MLEIKVLINGDWITLPMDATELKNITQEKECIIDDMETNVINGMINSYDDIYALNLLVERANNENVDIDIINAIIEVKGCCLQDALEIVLSKRYEYYWNVNNEEELGRAVVKNMLEQNNCIDMLNELNFDNFFFYKSYGASIIHAGYNFVSSGCIYLY